MGELIIEGDTGSVSDGYHTFDQLYEHRCWLFLALMLANKEISWIARYHYDGTHINGYLIAGMNLPNNKQITYHIPVQMVEHNSKFNILDFAPPWDYHTSDDVIDRLRNWVNQ